jgi:hypothetical protein
MPQKEHTRKIVEICFLNVPEDDEICEEVDKHLSILKRDGFITVWYASQLNAGAVSEIGIKEHLDNAHIVVILVSPDFIASPYCSTLWLEQVMQRHYVGHTHIIPVITRPVNFQGAPFDKLLALPKNGRSIATCRHKDQALLDVANEIRKVITEMNVFAYRDRAPANNLASDMLVMFQETSRMHEEISKMYQEMQALFQERSGHFKKPKEEE